MNKNKAFVYLSSKLYRLLPPPLAHHIYSECVVLRTQYINTNTTARKSLACYIRIVVIIVYGNIIFYDESAL